MVFKMYEHSKERSYTREMTQMTLILPVMSLQMEFKLCGKKIHLTREVSFWFNFVFLCWSFPKEMIHM